MDHKKPNRAFTILKIVAINIISIMILFAFFKMNVESEIKTINYNEFKSMVDNEKIEEVKINLRSPEFMFSDKEGKIYEAPNPKTDEFKKYLLENDIVVVEEKDKGNIISVILYFIQMSLSLLFIMYILKKTIPNTSQKMLDQSDSVVKLKEVEGLDEIKKDINILIDFLKNPIEYEKRGARIPKGIILYGPPGTGKTLTAKAIAGEAGVPFFSVSGSDFIEMYAGLGAKRVRDLYAEAKKNAPCIVFIDEIDAVGKKRGQHSNSELDQTINALLTALDGFDGSEGIITMAATNRVEDLDQALIRPGRFDKQLAIPLPDKHSRYEILKLHAKNKKLSKDIDLEELSRLTVGFSGAALESLLNEATIISISNNHAEVTKDDIDDAFYKILMKGNKKDNQDKRDLKELKLVAWHEAGHALLTKLLTEDEVTKVTILASTSGAGGVTFSNPQELSLYSKEYIESKIAIMYGGRIAEYLLLGSQDKITTGASNDIQQATRLIKGYITYYGMSDTFGMINVEELFGQQASQLGANELILKESTLLSKRIYDDALKILTNNKHILSKIAKELLINETLTDNDLNDIIDSETVNL